LIAFKNAGPNIWEDIGRYAPIAVKPKSITTPEVTVIAPPARELIKKSGYSIGSTTYYP